MKKLDIQKEDCPNISDLIKFGSAIGCAVVILVAVIWTSSALYKEYSIWSERKRGEAEYANAEANRRISILEADAKKEAAYSLAEAEIIRAEGVAKANKIIGDSLRNNEGYLRYLWIDGLQNSKQQVIYVPTEANLPILESRRLAQ